MRFILLLLLLVAIGGNAAAQTAPEKWRADLEIIRKEIPTRHPDLFKYTSKKKFEQALKDIADNLGGKADMQIALEIQSALSLAVDQNTHLELTPMLMSENPIPYGLGYYADGLYVSGTVKRFEKAVGKKVLKINGIDTKEALEKISRYIATENKFCVYKEGLNYLRFPVAFRQAGISTTDTLNLTLENKTTGKPETVKLFPIDINNRKEMVPTQIQQEKRDIRWQPAKGFFTEQWLASDSVYYLQINRCASSEMALTAGDSASAQQLPPFKPFEDAVIAFLQSNPNAKVLIDLRFNPGGGGGDGVRLAQRISEIPTANRSGKLFVAVNLYTSAAAIQVAAAFRTKTKAALIGETPAGRPNQFGDNRAFTLPNSRIQIWYPTTFKQTVKGNPDTLELDTPIPLNFEDFRKGKDPVLDYVRKLK
ncbi:MAG: hypothetical protein WCR52_03475 [Bacteroidota bacterium]